MYMNFTSSGDYRCYGVAVIPGQSMDSSAIPCEDPATPSNVGNDQIPEIDWKSILPVLDLAKLQPA